MKLRFHPPASTQLIRKPAPANLPVLQTASLAALYRAARAGGDFFDFQCLPGRLLFLLLDIAGKREQALNIAADAQAVFQNEGARSFKKEPLNAADALSELAILLNRAIMKAAGGVGRAPAFLGCYDEKLGILFYINAGHTPGLLTDLDGVSLLESNGLPLGLFSHSTHDAQTCVLQPGAAVLMVSKGLIESKSGRHEFGLARLQKSLQSLRFSNANELCSAVLASVQEFTGNTRVRNDVTALALMRYAAALPATMGIA